MTSTFTLRTGVVLASAAVEYPATGGHYDITAALTAGSGSIVTSNEGLAGVLRTVRTGDGTTLLPSRVLLPSRTLRPSSGGGPLLAES